MFMSPIVANYFIKKANEESVGLCKVKINKLVFVSHAWYLAYYSKPLIIDNVVCSIDGLMIPSLTIYFDDECSEMALIESFPNVFSIKSNNYIVEVLNKVWDKYVHLDLIELSALLNAETNLTTKHFSLKLSKIDNGPIVHNDAIEKEYKKVVFS